MKITDPVFTDALQRFADKHGREWRAKLWDAWLSSQDDYLPDGALLRQVRNHPDRDKVLDSITPRGGSPS